MNCLLGTPTPNWGGGKLKGPTPGLRSRGGQPSQKTYPDHSREYDEASSIVSHAVIWEDDGEGSFVSCMSPGDALLIPAGLNKPEISFQDQEIIVWKNILKEISKQLSKDVFQIFEDVFFLKIMMITFYISLLKDETVVLLNCLLHFRAGGISVRKSPLASYSALYGFV